MMKSSNDINDSNIIQEIINVIYNINLVEAGFQPNSVMILSNPIESGNIMPCSLFTEDQLIFSRVW